jgi:ribose 5-phosphate isomerase B
MKVAVACDHAGFPLKQAVLEAVRAVGHEPIDLGTYADHPPIDWPDVAEWAGRAIQRGEAERGIVICGSGVGVAVAANKLRGIRAGMCHDTYSAHQSVEHDNANMLSLGARVIGPELAEDVVKSFLGARFSGEERHVKRLAKLDALEANEVGRRDE